MAEIGLVFTLGNLISIITPLPLGRLADRFNKKYVLASAFGLLAVFIYLLTLCSNLVQIIAVLALSSVPVIACAVTVPALMAEIVPSKILGTIYSIRRILSKISVFIGSLLGGILWDINIVLPFYTETFLLMLATITVCFIPRNTSKILSDKH